MFTPHGTVQSAQVIIDKSTSQSKGFGFVEMGSDQEAKAAINALNGQQNDGRALTVNEAKPRENRNGGSGGRSYQPTHQRERKEGHESGLSSFSRRIEGVRRLATSSSNGSVARAAACETAGYDLAIHMRVHGRGGLHMKRGGLPDRLAAAAA